MNFKFSIFRYNQNSAGHQTYMQDYVISREQIAGNMVLDALIAIQTQLDPSLAFRKSCREGVCGTDGMNINGKNTLACIVALSDFDNIEKIVIKPLPGMPVIKDLIVDFTRFFNEYEKIHPYLQNDTKPEQERLQSIEQRKRLDGLYECVLCGCCSSACPVYVKVSDQFIGPAAMLQAARFIADSRDTKTAERLERLEQAKSLFKCRNVLTCIDACPKGLDPNNAINEIHKKAME